MNIFALDQNTKLAAEYHNDKHCVKMILEYCQLLSTAHRFIDGEQIEVLTDSGRRKKIWLLQDERENKLYSATHVNHPSAIWCRMNTHHYTWLHALLVDLCGVYTARYGRVHKCQSTGLVEMLRKLPRKISFDAFVCYPTPAMPEQYKVPGDVIQSYRNYYIGDKQRMTKWGGKLLDNTPPPWFILDGYNRLVSKTST